MSTKTSTNPTAQISRLLRLSVVAALGGSLALLFAESFFYQGFVAKHLHLQPLMVAGGSLTWAVLIRLLSKNSAKLPEQIFAWLYWYIVPVFSIFALGLRISQDAMYTNFPFQTFHLHPGPTMILAAYLMAVIAVSYQVKVASNKPGWSFFVAPIILLSNLVYFKWQYQNSWWHQLRREDGPFEYVTALAFFACSLIAIRFLLKLKKMTPNGWKRTLLIGLFAVIAIGNFVVAGEEISWGQRLLGLETPESWAQVNTQGEITLHNHEKILQYVYQTYFLISAYCAFAWLVVKAVSLVTKTKSWKTSPWLKLLVPSWYLLPYFLPTLFYTTGRFTIGWSYYGLGQWEETTEMILSLGLLFFMLDLWRQRKTILPPLVKKQKSK